MAKVQKSARKRLKAKLEISTVDQPVPVEDSVDPELGTYMEAFLDGLPEAVKLEKISLATPDQAKEALVVIEQTLERLNRQVANARALQRLFSDSRNR